MDPVKRVIWMLWLQGWECAPRVATTSRSRFEAMNPGWDVIALDGENFADHLDSAAQWIRPLFNTIPPAAFSDLLRAELLRQHGGVWADATLIPLRPLDEWLPVVGGAGFFAFRNPGPDRALSTWFLASAADHPLIRKWGAAAHTYWSQRSEIGEYHWFHYEFGRLVEEDPEAAALWREVPDLPSKAPHHLLPHKRRLAAPPTPNDLAVFEGDSAPVLKLSHKFGTSFPVGSNWETILQPTSPHLMHRPPHTPTPSLAGQSYVLRGRDGPRLTAVTATLRARGARTTFQAEDHGRGQVVIEHATNDALPANAHTVRVGNGRTPNSDPDVQPFFSLGVDSGFLRYPDLTSTECLTSNALVSVLARSLARSVVS